MDRFQTRPATDDKTRELVSTQRSASQRNASLSLPPRNEYSQSKPFTSSAPSNVQSCALVRTRSSLCRLPSYKLLFASRKSMEHHLQGNGFCSPGALWLGGKIGLQTKACIKNISANPSLRNSCFFLLIKPLACAQVCVCVCVRGTCQLQNEEIQIKSNKKQNSFV